MEQREVEGLKGVVAAGLKVGDMLPLDEKLWRRFINALWSHAQDIALLTRVGYRRPS